MYYTFGRRSFQKADHPRGCGEHVSFATCDGLCVGSSPRMRGTLERPAGGMAGVWIIPADAGNTLKNPSFDGCLERAFIFLQPFFSHWFDSCSALTVRIGHEYAYLLAFLGCAEGEFHVGGDPPIPSLVEGD